MPRTKDTIKHEGGGWWRGYDATYDLKLMSSSQTRDVYHFLSRCANKEGQAFPSYSCIVEHCNIKRDTVSKALKELQALGLLVKEKRTNSNGRTSNLYTIMEPRATPKPPQVEKNEMIEQQKEILRKLIDNLGVEEIRKILDDSAVSDAVSVSPNGERTPVRLGDEPQSVRETNPSPLGRREGRHIEGRHIEGRGEPPEAAPETPAPEIQKSEVEIIHGAFENVRLTKSQYDSLLNKHGKANLDTCIERLDAHMASEGKTYKNHAATIQKWIIEGLRNNKPKPAIEQETNKRRNKFANFKGRERDFKEFERMERERILKEYAPDATKEGDE